MSETTTPPPGPLVIAHRGASGAAPENTIAAFELALSEGADAIELDVHLSRDDQPVVIHDFTLERTTSGAGVVGARTVRELKRLDAGGWHGVAFRGQRIQTLQEVLERFRDRTRFWIDLRGGADLYPAIAERVVSALEIYDVLERALVQSFDYRTLAQIRQLNPEVRIAASLAGSSADQALGVAGAVHAVCVDARDFTSALAGRIREAGLGCYVWLVNDPSDTDRLVAAGVDGIITESPGLLRARLGP